MYSSYKDQEISEYSKIYLSDKNDNPFIIKTVMYELLIGLFLVESLFNTYVI